jgi:hypothetical protein
MEDCPVCLESLSEKISIRIPCSERGHVLCMKCFIHIEKKECPLCRTNFEKYLPYINGTARMTLIEFLRQME